MEFALQVLQILIRMDEKGNRKSMELLPWKQLLQFAFRSDSLRLERTTTKTSCNYDKATFPWNRNGICQFFGSSSSGAIHPRKRFLHELRKPPKKVGFVRLGGLQRHGSVWLGHVCLPRGCNRKPTLFFFLAIAGQNFQGKSDSSLSTRSNSKKNWPMGLIISLASICWIKPYTPEFLRAKEPKNWCFGGVARCFSWLGPDMSGSRC